MTSIYRYLSLSVWGKLPSTLQRNISQFYAQIYDRSYTKYIIEPYCRFNKLDKQYLSQFRSATGSDHYANFQDFFTRVYKERPTISSKYIWPCEGLLCDYGQVGDLPAINVKGDVRDIRAIFGNEKQTIPDTHYFTNVFLHNNNYHRIHAPTSGKISRIEHIPGDLVVLRPWIYKNDPSLPAMRNERVNLTIEDDQGRHWYLSIVGGPAVGTIELPENIAVDNRVRIGDEVGKFLLGSTLCMAAPVPTDTPLNSTVYVAQMY